MSRKRWLFLFIPILLILSSCGDSSLFMERPGEDDPVSVRTIREGAVISSGVPVPYSLSFSSSSKGVTVSSLGIEVKDRQGVVVISEILDQEDLSGSPPELLLTGIATGEYVIRFTVKEGSAVLHEKEVDFFFTNEPLSIREIRVYPPSLYPGSVGLLYADAEASEKVFYRWSVGKEVIAQGTRGQGFDLVRWSAPQNEGVYTVKLELFPVEPASGGGYGFNSPVSMSAQAFVSKEQRPGRYEFQPDDRFYSLLHFRGDLRDTGTRKAKTDIAAAGKPILTVRNGVFGYALERDSGFSVQDTLLPLDNGKLLPFSLKFRMIADSPSGDALYSWTSDSGGLLASLFCDEGGTLVFTLSPPGSAEITSKLTDVSLDGLHTLTVSVFPKADSTSIAFYLDDTLRSWETYGPLPAAFPRKGRSLIGGFSGIIDEFGVYAKDSAGRPSPDADIFAGASRARYGDSVILAEGFDGLYLPEGFTLGGKNEAGLSEGRLSLNGTELLSKVFSISEEETLNVEVSYSSAGSTGFDLVIEDGGGASLQSIPCAEEASGLSSLALSLSIPPDTESLILERNGRKTMLNLSDSFRLRFSPRGAAGGGDIESILIFRSGAVISERDGKAPIGPGVEKRIKT